MHEKRAGGEPAGDVHSTSWEDQRVPSFNGRKRVFSAPNRGAPILNTSELGLGMEISATASDLMRRIVLAYDGAIVRAYCSIRFRILRQRFLSEIGQYIPDQGVILDVGCGFGLFALYFASQRPGIRIQGFDLNPRRVEMASKAAERLGVRNVTFRVGDAAAFRFDEPIAAAYLVDLLHHIPQASVGPLLRTIGAKLQPGGRILVKDIEPSPKYKLAFTWILDKLMDPRAPVRYWAPQEIRPVLESLGFEVHSHRMIDYLPYPHVLYVSTKRSAVPLPSD
jgi:2-polyprenyl-3-methyl-5-hydroxy-6-metoxy-1,4-benzoquinol methylase